MDGRKAAVRERDQLRREPEKLRVADGEAIGNDVEPDLNGEQDALYPQVCGIVSGLVEAHATPEY